MERGSGAGTLLPDRETWQSIDDMLARGAVRVEQLAVKQPGLGANNPALVSGMLASQVVRSPEFRCGSGFSFGIQHRPCKASALTTTPAAAADNLR